MHRFCKFGGQRVEYLALYLRLTHVGKQAEGLTEVLEPSISFDPSVSFRSEEADISRSFCREFTSIECWKPLVEPCFQAMNSQCS